MDDGKRGRSQCFIPSLSSASDVDATSLDCAANPRIDFKQLRPATVNRELACLKHLPNCNESIVPKNPVKGVKFLKEDNEQTRVLNSEEEKLSLLWRVIADRF